MYKMAAETDKELEMLNAPPQENTNNRSMENENFMGLNEEEMQEQFKILQHIQFMNLMKLEENKQKRKEE